ncbi:hypothetical protein GW17_00049889 [Ensete ventricosum]|nr:hypothetical protein GW17_00049889 [Ensete ventricosum]
MRTRIVSSTATHDKARSACHTYIRSHASGCASSTSLLVRSVKEAASFRKGHKVLRDMTLLAVYSSSLCCGKKTEMTVSVDCALSAHGGSSTDSRFMKACVRACVLSDALFGADGSFFHLCSWWSSCSCLRSPLFNSKQCTTAHRTNSQQCTAAPRKRTRLLVVLFERNV